VLRASLLFKLFRACSQLLHNTVHASHELINGAPPLIAIPSHLLEAVPDSMQGFDNIQVLAGRSISGASFVAASIASIKATKPVVNSGIAILCSKGSYLIKKGCETNSHWPIVSLDIVGRPKRHNRERKFSCWRRVSAGVILRK
jgi:hypothetical protein